MKAKPQTLRAAVRNGLRPEFLLMVVVTLGLAACSSGLNENVPELEQSASTKKTTSQVSSYSDNAEERSYGTTINSSTDIELTHDVSRGQQVVGLRFDNLKVPRGADIKNAYIQFTADETDSSYIKVKIHAHDTDDASGFPQGDSRYVSKRSKTSNSKSWTIDDWNKKGERGSRQRTPDLDSVLEEVTDRKGWDYGNAVVFIISSENKDGRRVAESYRGSKSGAPSLVVEYSGGDSGSSSSSGSSGSSAPVAPGPEVKGDIDYYISKSGSDSNSGSKSKPLRTLLEADKRAKPGDIICFRSGTYTGFGNVYAGYDRRPFQTDGRKGAPITIMSCPGEKATLDGSSRSYKSSKSISSPSVLSVKADHIIVQNLTLRDGAGRGLVFKGNNITIRNVTSHGNHSDGIYLDGSNGRLENIKSYDNYSRQNGGDSADGIKLVYGSNIYIKNCRVYDNSDDGLDIWNTRNTTVDNCEANNNGRGSTGNGNGFKGGSKGSNNTGSVIKNSEARGNRINFTSNNSTGVTFSNNVSRNADSIGFSINSGNTANNNKSISDPKNYVRGVRGSGNSW